MAYGLCSTERRPAVHQLSRALEDRLSPNLLLEHLFDLSDLLLNFAGVLFGVAFVL
jgi:hypothetical protein